MTALTLTAASFSMFLNGLFFERTHGKILPLSGFVLTAIAAVLSIFSIWDAVDFRPFTSVLVLLFANFCLFPLAFNYEERRKFLIPAVGAAAILAASIFAVDLIWQPFFDRSFKLLIISIIIGTACIYLSIIVLVPLAKKHSWLSTAVNFAVIALSALLIFTVLIDPTFNRLYEEILLRLTVILAIVLAALTVLIPIFYRLSLAELTIPDKLSLKDIERRITQLKDKISRLEELKRGLVESSDNSIP